MKNLKEHLDFLVSHARSNANKYPTYDGSQQDIMEGIEKAKKALTERIVLGNFSEEKIEGQK